MGTHAALAAKREKRNAYMRGWAAKNPGKNRAYSQRAKKARPWASNFSERKKGAARRGILFTLTVEDLARVWTGKCAITGLPFDGNYIVYSLLIYKTYFPHKIILDSLT